MCCQCVFSTPGAEMLKLPLRPDSVGGERGEQGMWALGLPVWGSRLWGDKLLAIYPTEPLACSIYGNTTDTSEIQVDPFSSPQKAAGVGVGGGDLCPSFLKRHKYQICGQLGGNHPPPPNRKIILVSFFCLHPFQPLPFHFILTTVSSCYTSHFKHSPDFCPIFWPHSLASFSDYSHFSCFSPLLHSRLKSRLSEMV